MKVYTYSPTNFKSKWDSHKSKRAQISSLVSITLTSFHSIQRQPLNYLGGLQEQYLLITNLEGNLLVLIDIGSDREMTQGTRTNECRHFWRRCKLYCLSFRCRNFVMFFIVLLNLDFLKMNLLGRLRGLWRRGYKISTKHPTKWHLKTSQ